MCPLCDAGNNAYPVGLLTVIDHRKKSAKGKDLKPGEKKVFKFRNKTLALLVKKAAALDGLQGGTFTVDREDSQQSPKVGTAFEIVGKKLSPAALVKAMTKKYGEGDYEPFDYDEIFPLMSEEDMRKIAGMPDADSDDLGGMPEGGDDEPSDEDIPF